MQPKVIVTGSSGLIGSAFLKASQNKYQVVPCDLHDPNFPVDICNPKVVEQFFLKNQPNYVVHFAAFTDVTNAWQQTDDKNGLCYQLNVGGTQNIVNACQLTGAKLIHISTAFVFDGSKTEKYLESDKTNPIEWYGYTKALAEEVVQSSDINHSILRIDKPFTLSQPTRPDIVSLIIQAIQSNQLYPQFTDHFFGPTLIEDFVKIIQWAIRSINNGIYHASSGESWSDFDFTTTIVKALNLNFEVKSGSLAEYLKNNHRPWQKNTALNIDKLRSKLDFDLISIDKALSRVTREL